MPQESIDEESVSLMENPMNNSEPPSASPGSYDPDLSEEETTDDKGPKKPGWIDHLKEFLRKLTENKFYIALFLIATIFTLFADDIRILAMPKSADVVMQGLMFATLLLFGACYCY